jgi:hypothetical protein
VLEQSANKVEDEEDALKRHVNTKQVFELEIDALFDQLERASEHVKAAAIAAADAQFRATPPALH